MNPNTLALQQEVAGLSISVLEAEIAALQNSTTHLRSSNLVLRQAMQVERDLEYKSAIEENIVLIAKQEARVEKLQEDILAASGSATDSCSMHATSEGAIPTVESQGLAQVGGEAQGMDVDGDATPPPGADEGGTWL